MRTELLSDFDDEQLFQLFVAKSRKDCLGEIFRRYRHLLLGVCIKYLKDPAESKDTLIEVFERILSHDSQKLALVENVKAWLYSITRNYCIDKIRSRVYHDEKKSEVSAFFYDRNVESDPLERLINKQLAERKEAKLHSSISKLKTDHQTCINLFYFNGKTYKQIADETGLSLKQVKSNLQNGKIALKNLMIKAG